MDDVDTVIRHLSENIGNDWKCLGRGLGFGKTDLDGIEVANPYVLSDQIHGLFHLWKTRNGPLATVQTLKAAAQSAGLRINGSLIEADGGAQTGFGVAEYIEYLRDKYITDLSSAQPLLPVPVKEHVNLHLVQNDDGEEEDLQWVMWEAVHGNSNTTKKKKKKSTPIDINKIEELSSLSRLVVVEGAPGVGKSCLAWKLGVLWKDKKLYQKCPVVVFIRLRDSSVQCAKEPQDLFLYPDQDVQVKVHSWVLRKSGRGCLLILDGYDELPAGAQTKSVFSRIIGGELLPQAWVIVTSRSSAMHNLLELCKTQEVQHVEILGFTEEQVNDYVSSAFKQDQKSRCGFEEYLRCHPHLQGLMYIPLNAAIVVGVYKASQEKGYVIPKTMTELYTALVLYLVHHHHHRDPANSPMGPTERISDLPAHYYKSIKSMAEIAYQGCLEDKLVFQKMPMSLETLGLMDKVSELHHGIGAQSISCNFLHKTLQEYMAAFHVSLLPPQEQVRVLDTLSEKPQMKIVCRFLAGLTKFQQKSRCCFLWNLLGHVSPLSYVQSFHTRGEGCLVEVLHWLYETQQPALVEKVLGGIKREVEFSSTLSPFDCYVLGYIVVNSQSPWTLAFNGCGISSKGVEMLLQHRVKGQNALSRVRKLRFWSNPVHDRGAECIGEAMKNNDCVTELELSSGGITSAALKQLCVSLHGNITLTTLDISNNHFMDSDIRGLQQLLAKNRSLTRLNISLCKIGPTGVKEICSALCGNTTLTVLEMSGNTFDMQSVAAFGRAIEGNRSLAELKLIKCGLDDDMMQCLVQGIVKCSLKLLDVCNNPFSVGGAKAVAELMRNHKSIEDVWVWSENLSCDGVRCLLEAVKSNVRIKKLLLNSSIRDQMELVQFADLEGRVVYN